MSKQVASVKPQRAGRKLDPRCDAAVSLAIARRASLHGQWCFVCGDPVEGGVYDGPLRILTHRGPCAALVDHEARVYDRSARGRWRPAREVLQRLQAYRVGRLTPDPALVVVTAEESFVAWKIAVQLHGSEGYRPRDDQDCPYFHAYHVASSCVSGSGGSCCGGFMGSTLGSVYCIWGLY